MLMNRVRVLMDPVTSCYLLRIVFCEEKKNTAGSSPLGPGTFSFIYFVFIEIHLRENGYGIKDHKYFIQSIEHITYNVKYADKCNYTVFE